jgi:hypothetical protein
MNPLRFRAMLARVGPLSLFLAASCGQGGATRGSEASGSIGLALQVSPGGVVSEATYTISGPNGFASAGTVAVGDSPDLAVVVSHLPLGIGYEMDVTATSSDGSTNCDGTATFDVTDTDTATVIVHLICGAPTGDVNVTGRVNICPVLDSLGASPSQVAVGGIVLLTSAAHDADNGPAALSYTWTANGADLKQRSQNLSFACSTLGTVTLKVTASDGDPNPSCADTMAVDIRCTAP